MLPPASKEQIHATELFREGHNVLVQAVAGGGKTTGFLYMCKAAYDDDPDTHILLICYNKALQLANHRRIEAEGMSLYMDAFTVHGLASQMFGVMIPDDAALDAALTNKELCDRITLPAQYTDVFVDELQDMSGFTLAVVNLVLDRIMADRTAEMQVTDDSQSVEPPAKRRCVERLGPRLVCVGDRRQEIYGYNGDHTGLRCLDTPHSAFADTGRTWRECHYSVSFRLTPAICHFVNRQFAGTVYGPSVDIVPGNTWSKDRKPIYIVGDQAVEGVAIVQAMLVEYSPSEIMILAPSIEVGNVPSKHVVNCLSRQYNNAYAFYVTDRMRGLSEDAEYEDKVLVTTFHQAKGSERPCVIVFADDSCIWEQRDPKGLPYCHNSLHVALTRAQETLILIHHSANGAYPTIDEHTLPQMADWRQGNMLPLQPRWRSSINTTTTTNRRANHTVAWLVKHCPVTVYNQIMKLCVVSDLQRVGPPVDAVPRTSVMIPPLYNHENVIRYFPAAIMAATERQLMEQRTGHRHVSQLEYRVRQCQDVDKWPAVYRTAVDLAAESGPQRPRDWLLLSVIGDAAETGYYHRLCQLTHFDWVHETENKYFDRCVANITAILLKDRLHADTFFAQDSRTFQRSYRFRSTIPYVQQIGVNNSAPWSFCFGADPTQEEILVLICHMWLRYALVGYLAVVPDNMVMTIEFESYDALNQAVTLLVNNKTTAR